MQPWWPARLPLAWALFETDNCIFNFLSHIANGLDWYFQGKYKLSSKCTETHQTMSLLWLLWIAKDIERKKGKRGRDVAGGMPNTFKPLRSSLVFSLRFNIPPFTHAWCFTRASHILPNLCSRGPIQISSSIPWSSMMAWHLQNVKIILSETLQNRSLH